MHIRPITNFFNNEYCTYAENVIVDRAIPHFVDGFKPIQRKIIYVANQLFKSEKDKPKKVFQLTGVVADRANYHHGDASLNKAIINMTQDFKNSMPLFKGDGQFGSLRVPTDAQPRYVGVSMSNAFHKLYKDFELIESRIEDGVEVEPYFYLPIIPMVIVNGSSGIAVGYASNILNRNVIDVIDACLNVLNNKKIKTLYPYVKGFTGEVRRDDDNPLKWWRSGKIEVVNTSTLKITELHPHMSLKDYETFLDGLCDDKVIVDYENNSTECVEYIIKMRRDDLANAVQNNTLDKIFKLTCSDTENITVIDHENKLRIYNNVEELVSDFVHYRLQWYDKRKNYIIDKLTKEMRILSNKAKFIKHIIEKKLKINNMSKNDLIEYLDKNKFDKEDNSYSYLYNMPIHSLTKETYDAILYDFNQKEIELKKIKDANIKDMYEQDLKDLKKELKGMNV